MKQFLNAAIVISFFSLVAAAIWVVWDKTGVTLNVLKTAAIVFGTALLCKCKEVWVLLKEL